MGLGGSKRPAASPTGQIILSTVHRKLWTVNSEERDKAARIDRMATKSDKELIYAPGGNGAAPVEEQELLPALDDMTPREIVAELDKYIVGQTAAKRAVAVALRNRVRRQKLPPEIAEDVLPKNILMIGPTGVGKTEIARRLARLAGCPFVKVEASKYTEVGYVGRDVESMVRDLVETSIDMIREEKLDEVADRA